MGTIEERLVELERSVRALENAVDVTREQVAHLESAIALLRKHVGRVTLRPPALTNELAALATNVEHVQGSLEALAEAVLRQSESHPTIPVRATPPIAPEVPEPEGDE